MTAENPPSSASKNDELAKYIYKADSSLTDADVSEIKQRLVRQKGHIHNTKAYIRTVVANYRLERHIPTPKRTMGYPATYDLEAYEKETSGPDYIAQLMAELEDIRPKK